MTADGRVEMTKSEDSQKTLLRTVKSNFAYFVRIMGSQRHRIQGPNL